MGTLSFYSFGDSFGDTMPKNLEQFLKTDANI